MVRGFVSGLVWGGVVASAGLAVISQITPLPQPVATAPAASDAETPVAPEGATEQAAAPVATDAPAPAEAAQDGAEGAGETAAAEVPAQPEEAPAFDMADATAPDAPKAPAAPGQAPALEGATEATPDSAPPPATATAAAPDNALPDIEPPPPAPLDEALLAPPAEPAPAAPAGADVPPAEDRVTAAPEASPPAEAPAPAEKSEDSTPLPQIADGTAPATPPADPSPPVADPAPEAADPLPGLAADELPAEDPSVSTDRLPRIGDAEPLPEVEVLPDSAAPARPIEAFARPYEPEGEKPLFAILLADTGAPDLDRKALAALPFPVTFVIDPLAPNAAEAAAIYRAGMQEVVYAATGLPQGATAADVEQTFQSHATTLPEAVGVIDLPETGFQADRGIATAVLPILAEQGRGLLTYERGLNAADQIARREGIPAATIFRRLDAEGESIPTMRRYLDRAAFRAAQEGEVVVIGTTVPDTVAAILEWSVEGRAASVSLAPASAVMTRP